MEKINYCIWGLLLICFSLVVNIGSADAQAEASFLYRLSDFSGPVSSMWARIDIDPKENEVYTLNRSNARIQIFNETAMQVFDCGEGLNLASATDIASTPEGDLFVLYRSPAGTVRYLDYRGEVIRDFVVRAQQTPGGFQPDYIDFQDGRLYVVDSGAKQVVIVSSKGEHLDQVDLNTMLTEEYAKKAADPSLNPARKVQSLKDLESVKAASFGGFSVDSHGNLYFTLSSLFVAYRYTPFGELQAFGIPGSSPGKFGVVSSIAADGEGNIFVSDRLRSVVLMFDRELNFRSEFGYRGSEPHNLIAPNDIAIDEQNRRIYVAQAANLGVSVFSFPRD